ncbi:MAG TPA: type II toxin-antitoxin system VapC family toxin [Ktedonobacteraceae bacterium]
MKSAIVVDTSVVLKWVLDEPDSAPALTLLTRWVNEGTLIQAPALLTYEVANALFQRVRKGEMTAEKARQALEDVLLPELELNFLEYTELGKRAITLAQQYSLPATYDAHYLALAEYKQCEYWTADTRLWNAIGDKLPWVRRLSDYQSMMH